MVAVVQPIVERRLQDEEDIKLLSPPPLLIGNLVGAHWYDFDWEPRRMFNSGIHEGY